MDSNGNRLPIIESLILSSPEPLPARKIMGVVDNLTVRQIEEAVEQLNSKYMENALSFRIRKIANGFQSYILEDYTQYVEELLMRRRNVRLTRASLETLAIVAYRQPVTKMDIEMIRGVASDSVLRTLLERKLITMAGRAETVGKPLLYKTTDEFLKFFNLNSIEDLPRMGEIEELLAAGESESQPMLPLASVQAETQTENDDTISDEIDFSTDSINSEIADGEESIENESDLSNEQNEMVLNPEPDEPVEEVEETAVSKEN